MLEKHENLKEVTFYIRPFINQDDTPNLEDEWIQVSLDKRFGDVVVLNFIKSERVNAYECMAISSAWEKANEIARAFHSRNWEQIVVDKTVDTQS